MKGQLDFFGEKGFNCIVVTSNGNNIRTFASEENCEMKIINMDREISLFKDIVSLVKIISFFIKEKPQIVNAGTPKAGLLMMIAAFVTRVPVRIYTLRGLRLETAKGLKKKVLSVTEKIAMLCSTKTIAISPSLRKTTLESKFIRPNKISVLGKGSSNGVNIEKFRKSESVEGLIRSLREKYDIDNNDFVIGFTGRITKDKGVDDIVTIFKSLLEKGYNIKLLLVGEIEENDSILNSSRRIIENHPKVIHVGFQQDTVPYYYLMKVFLFLTNREGFGNVAIEGALTGLPVIVKNVTGAKDTVINDKTGYIIENDSLEQVEEKIINLYQNEQLRKKLGENGTKWVKENFSHEVIHTRLYEFYLKQLQEKRIDF